MTGALSATGRVILPGACLLGPVATGQHSSALVEADGTAVDLWFAPAALGTAPGGLMTIITGDSDSTGASWTLGLDDLGRVVVHHSRTDVADADRLTDPVPVLAWTHVRLVLARAAVTVVVGDVRVELPAASAARWRLSTASRAWGAGPTAGDGVEWYGGFVGVIADVIAYPGDPGARSRPRTDPADVWSTVIGSARDEPDRPRWHFMPPTGWMNEPHGVLHYAGRHHVFYQRNELGPFWGAITWGHAVSDNLIDWTDLGSALSPRRVPYAPQGVWSGSSVTDDGQPVLVFTAGDDRESPNQRTALARAADPSDPDLREWTPAPEPVTRIHDAARTLATGGVRLLPEFRDPFVWREDDHWFQLVGAGIEGAGGTALLFRAPSVDGPWEFLRPLLVGDVAARPDTGVMWELPALVPVGVDSTGQMKHLFLATPWWPSSTEHSLQHQWCWIGVWDPGCAVFTPDSSEPKSLDIGGYLTGATPSRTEDGRTLVWSITQDLLPETEHRERGWAGCAGVPLEVSIGPDDSLAIQPISELSMLRREPVDLPVGLRDVELDVGPMGEMDLKIELPVGGGIRASWRTADDGSDGVVLDLSRDQRGVVVVTVDGPAARGRRRAEHQTPVRSLVRLRIVWDHSVVEAFVDHAISVTTRAWSPSSDTWRIALRDGASIRTSAAWPLAAAVMRRRRSSW